MIQSDRYARQQDLVPPQRLESLSVAVIGVGAIGRQVAVQLAALGVSRMLVVDFDRVDITNIATQGYRTAELGEFKVEATAIAALDVNPDIHITRLADRFRPGQPPCDAIFCCVDSIAARTAIWRSVADRCEFWADGRMLGEVIRVLVACDTHGRAHYRSTLFSPADAQQGSCTSRSTIYTANVAAGLMLHQFARWLRHQPVDSDLCLNLLSSELTQL